ncbi:ABC transporter substrate-binding protein [Rhodospirillum rubrum]|uniref:Extracellular solute-binding protein, family 3 n=1 Tax=Rhodospirillum rubrum (strain ATCC 11170 / ATH 1.1.1 / DSM 467 / LMG 4362 / NCIMB 8255 / S1) TaxID=269796 RepID=Q2RS44_RHORT|nr:ABC transporter substrate-binding protein [Rhodospirillum rubrum]ABC23051.1 extracellular solute-binding protein, family 3 [Rhodospirillum rubrum ATCC 11170]AEO48780.1 extracellular solute-binding protein [Rhodospirillum rubrum F11]MBK5954678.1 amino acid ABC transporter [Rhodospirillum rubrum]QXG79035.1 ABC transporter substrate-binding protein [Rhodospirillum rubrum]HAP99201.1 amino acid ABC transporter [Rhodospirillum rubrum]
MISMKKTATALFAAAGILLGGQAVTMALGVADARAETIRFATEGAFPPFNFTDAAGKPQGFDIDIANALCAQLKAECSMVTQDWDGIIPGLLAKKYDAIIASMSITPERQQSVLFTDAYYNNQFHFVGPKGKDFDLSKAGLKGKAIGAQRATVSSQWIEDTLGDTVSLNLYDTAEEAYLDLEAGRVDLLLNDTYPTYDWLNSPAGQAYELKGESVIKDDVVGIALRKDDTALAAKLNGALKEIIANGTYAKINEKYFPFSLLN